MKLIVERDAFADALGFAKHATDKSLKIPVLANALLRVNGASLHIAATNLDVRSEASVAADISGRTSLDSITVPVALLSDLASRISKGAQICLEWDDESKNVTLSAGRARYKLNALPSSDFPLLPDPEDAIVFGMPGKLLAGALNAVRWTTYDGVDRPHISGVYIHITDDTHPALGGSRKKRLAFVATDGKQLARFTTELPPGLESLPKMTLPNMAIGEIARLANDADGTVVIAASEARVSVSDGNAKFLTKLLDTTFPAYGTAIPDVEDARMLTETGALRDALLRLKALGEDFRTRTEIANGVMKLSLSNHERGHAEEIVEVEFDSEPIALPINAGGILSIIDHMAADTCLFRFDRRAAKAITINPMIAGEIDYSRTFLTMPMER